MANRGHNKRQGGGNSAVATSWQGNSETLTWLAEMADGLRDKDLKLVMHSVNGLTIQPADYGVDDEVEYEVCPIKTSSSQPDRTKVKAVEVITEDNKRHRIEVTDKEQWDAVFWSESAVEKFLYPYYHSHRTWSQTLDELKEGFRKDPSAFAVRHKAPSASDLVPLTQALQVGVARAGAAPKWVSMKEFLMK